MSYLRLWRYAVTPGREAEFEHAYGPDGDWARLFRLGGGYLGTELLQPVAPAVHWITIDHWRSAADWLDFLDRHAAAYHALDRRLAPLCDEDVEVGNFTLAPAVPGTPPPDGP